ncbi:MAG: dihydroorotase family protein [Promethearchaeota archaeon]
MILDNVQLFTDNSIRNGMILIIDGIINEIKIEPSEEERDLLMRKDKESNLINCEGRTCIPGIIDIHSHLRDLEQSEKETFQTGTMAAAFSGITTVFNMPNTKPPAITSDQVQKWMLQAQKGVYIDVGFISGVPRHINQEEIKKIIDLGVIGFKVYPHCPLSGIDWMNPLNIQAILRISAKYQVPIFFHPDIPMNEEERKAKFDKYVKKGYTYLKIHNILYEDKKEAEFISHIIDNYKKISNQCDRENVEIPRIHFCHVTNRLSYEILKDIKENGNYPKITFEITPHHLLLSEDKDLKNPNFGKVLPPLRKEEDQLFLFDKLKSGRIELIGTDHAPHTIEEKSRNFIEAPSGFPGFETYALSLMEMIPLNIFVRISAENPAIMFGLSRKGFIKEGFDADLVIFENVEKYHIDSSKFKTKAKFSPFEGFETSIKIWKVFLRGNEINRDGTIARGKIIQRK